MVGVDYSGPDDRCYHKENGFLDATLGLLYRVR